MSTGDDTSRAGNEPVLPDPQANDASAAPASPRHVDRSPFAHVDRHGPERRFVSATDDQLARQEFSRRARSERPHDSSLKWSPHAGLPARRTGSRIVLVLTLLALLALLILMLL